MLCFGSFEFDPKTGELRKHGLRIKLNGQPIEMLTMLLEQPGQVVTREALQERLWPANTNVDFEQSLNAAIKRLRAALGDSADAPLFIETLPRRGYRFIAPVIPPAGDVSLPVSSYPEPAALQPGVPKPVPSRPVRWRLFILTAAGVALLVLLFAISTNPSGVSDTLRTLVLSGKIRSLAVLPLVNLSRDSEQDYFVDGMTDALRERLEGISSLRVISRTSSMHYRGSNKPLREIARELNADAVVDGSVLNSGERVRISVELIQAGMDRHIWSNSYEGDLRDVFVLQASVAREIADEIRVTLTAPDRARLTRARTTDPDAYQAYSKGRFWWNKRTEEDLKKAIGFFQQAIDKDPNYALAYDGLADCWIPLGWYGFVAPSGAFPRARDAITKALSLDDSLAEAHTSLAFVTVYYDRDWAGADREFRRAIELNPNYANGHHWYAEFLSLVGRHAQAIAESQRARELDPLSSIIDAWVSSRYYFARHYEDAIKEGRNAVDLGPDFAPAHLVLGYAYEQKGMLREAITEFETASRLAAGSMYSASLAHALAGAGRRSEALNLLDALRATARRRFVSSYDLAICEIGMGNKEQTLDLLSAAVQEHSPRVAFIGVDPRFDDLRADRRFAALLRLLGLQSEASPAFPEAQSHLVEHRP
ncbi:MAG TPA: winged helix-turn-helix domain-containing protein [Bryobacteraceae bacterium]|nr:winged helix-turn-helix domain-containing protein [Bryobacteraceae bacterium]